MALRPGQLFENPRTGERGVVRIAPGESEEVPADIVLLIPALTAH